jgi:crotonobetainyl-CoA:carnitine CoA-transferase CaiB-like acyl-CoA transferase
MTVQGACAGLRVLDLSQGLAGPLATMILADFGADVIRVEPAGGDPGWEEPAYLLLQRGKRSIDLDLGTPVGLEALLRLLPGVDVLVETLGSRAEEAGIDYETLALAHPALVYCSITPFGPTGPLADLPADDALVMAKAGVLRDQPGWHHDGRRPVYRACNDASYFAAMLAVQGIVAALRARDIDGRGQHVATSLLQSVTCRNHPTIGWLLRDGEALPPDASGDGAAAGSGSLAHHRDPREAVLTGLLVECLDGRWLMHAQSEPHFFRAWIDAIGFDWIWDDPRYRGAPYQVEPDAKAELVGLIEARLGEKTTAEWMAAYLADGNVCADVVETTQEALTHPQVEAAGYVVELDDPRVGRVVQVAPLATIPGAPAAVRGPAPRPGADTDDVLDAPVVPVVVPAGARRPLDAPLDGITIVEAAYYAATPLGTAMLAELGARVVKIEPLKGDPYRRLAAGDGRGDPVRNLGHNNMARAMQGKESVALDLKDSRGQEVLHRLVAGADVFVHSFRVGVPEALCIDEPTLRAVNPELVYHYAGAYGSVGPYRRQPAIDPVIAAFAGTTAQQAGVGNSPLTEIGADPVAAAGAATALMLGLLARHRTGRGQTVESAMVLSNLYANAEDALAYEGKPPRALVDALQLGTGATHRLYETAPDPRARAPWANPDPRWVFVSAVGDDEFARFCTVAGRHELPVDPRFATRAARARNRASLEALLAEVLRARPAAEWESSLLAAGVGCVQADAVSHLAFLYTDPQAEALGMLTTTSHPSVGGGYSRHAPLVRFSATPGRAGPICELGEHTRGVLDELGYDQAEQDSLRDAGVVSWPEPASDLARAGR